MSRVAVLGAGLVGGPMALDLAKDPAHEVTVVDIDEAALDRISRIARVRTRRADLSRAGEVQAAVREAEIVLSAVPSFMGYATLRTVVETGKNVVDIAFFAE